MKKTTWCLTEQQIEGIKALSKITGLTQSEMVRQAITEYLKKENQARRLEK